MASWEPCRQVWLRSSGFPLALLEGLRTPAAAAAVDAALALQHAGDGAVDAAWAAADRALAEELLQARQSLRDVLADPRVREAIFLSNPRFAEIAAEHLTATAGRRDKRIRQKEKTAVRYLQRFAAKNDTVSFYGPLAWGTLDATAGKGVTAEPGSDLVSRRMVSMEHWAVQQLAAAISRDPDVEAQLALMRNPAWRREGAALRRDGAAALDADERTLAVLDHCDGTSGWAQVLAGLETHPAFSGDGPSPAEVAGNLLARRVLTRDILVPTVVANPERLLLARVEQLHEPARSRWRDVITWFVSATDAYAEADLPRRRQLLDELEGRFTEVARRPSTRRPGEMYAGRGLLYEDCERDVGDVTFGQTIADAVTALAPLLDIARWISVELALRYQDALRPIFLRLADDRGATDFARFVRETASQVAQTGIEDGLRAEVADAWVEALGDRWDPNARQVDVTAADCAAVLRALGELPAQAATRMLGADFHSLDLLLAATPAEAQVGDGTVVLGELHKAVFLAAQPVALPFCPTPDELFDDLRRAAGRRVLSLVDAGGAYQRSDMNWPDLPGFCEILTDGTATRFPPERAVAVGDLDVIEEGGDLYVVSRDGAWHEWIFSVLTGFLQHKLLRVDPFEVAGEHSPRVVLDGVVVRRESWRVDARRLRASHANPDSAARFGVARRLRHDLGLGEQVFVVSPAEQKPVFVDLGSFLGVELLLKLAEEADTLTLSEMLPAGEQLWLSDGGGATYTSEMRLTVFKESL